VTNSAPKKARVEWIYDELKLVQSEIKKDDRLKFLAYLVGMAALEAREMKKRLTPEEA
jgi:hypothetical protein